MKFLGKYPIDIVNNTDSIEISLNIDGLPIFRSTQKSAWPILCAIHIKPVTVFPVALTFGNSKPHNLEFLHDTIQDLGELLQNGMEYNNRNIQVQLRNIVCDAPARAMVKATKQYSGYYGCERCTQKGVWLNKVTYQDVANLTLRTDESFRDQSQEGHHHAISPFCDLPIDMISTFSLDYMHMCCLGVMKRLLLVWLRGKRATRMSAVHIQEVSTRLKRLKKFIPNTFARKPRGFEEIDRWKATELRQFLLYTGKLVLKDILHPNLYNHFMTLNVAMCILVCPRLVQDRVDYAEELLSHFVAEAHNIYGPEFLVYNIHGLLHVADGARQYGCLDNVIRTTTINLRFMHN
jgi:hypothetical protein